MGKSTIAKAFKDLGAMVWDADSAVHEIYQYDKGLIDKLANEFGDILGENGNIDRKKLANIVLNDDEKLKRLENFIHPLVRNHRENFIAEAKKQNETIVILDIPLLFETNSQTEFDKIILVNCSPETQKKRVLSRPNMTIEKFQAILSNQIENKDKISMSDFVIDTDKQLDETLSDVQQLYDKLHFLAEETDNA